MKSIDQFPGDEMALRDKLPEFKTETRDSLIRWGETQPGALPWLLKRTSRYWETLPPARQMTDEGSLACDATAALDLLRWRIEARDDRAAVLHLNETSVKPAKEKAAA